jgi:hypothetical protein
LQKAPEGEWSKFERFVRTYGVNLLAASLEVRPSAIYHWLRCSTAPHHTNATKIQELAKASGVLLSLDDIYDHCQRRVRLKASRDHGRREDDGKQAGRSKPVESLRRRD